MKRTALALVLSLAACAAPPSVGERGQSIINGTTDTTDTAVVALLSQVPGSQTGSLCTAEIVSPHVVLTAAHCVDPAVVGATAKFVVFTGTVLSNTSPTSDFLSVQEVHYDTAFDMNAPQNGHDVGVAILTNPTTITPIPYNRTPMTQSMVSQAARFVGYGVTSGTDTMGTTAGTRRVAPTVLASLDPTLLGFQDMQHGICEGDSGGPAFMTINGTEVIVGVTSFGLQGCPLTSPQAGIEAGNDTRIDAYTSMIDGWVTMFDPPAKSAGQQCSSDADCYPLSCVQTSIGKICEESCDPMAGTPTCGAGTQCTNVDGNNICASMSGSGGTGGSGGGSGGGKSGCDVGGHAPVSSAALLFVALFALALRRQKLR